MKQHITSSWASQLVQLDNGYSHLKSMPTLFFDELQVKFLQEAQTLLNR